MGQPLSVDHKPELKGEAERIIEAGGVIDSFYDPEETNKPMGPQRVWVKDENFPGLAMSRSLGDTVAHAVGVTSKPQVTSTLVGIDDKFVVIGSDGVWEFLTNQQIAEIVFPFYKQNQPETAANEIVKQAYKKWRLEEEVVDDITAVVIFMEPLMAYSHIMPIDQNKE